MDGVGDQKSRLQRMEAIEEWKKVWKRRRMEKRKGGVDEDNQKGGGGKDN